MAATVFGASIESINSRNGEKVPSVIQDLMRFLYKNAINLEGLFIVSAGVRDLEDLKRQVNTGSKVTLENKDPHVIAGLLKAFFIELPDPLLTFDLYDSFIEAADNKDRLKVVFQKLPEARKLTAAALCLFLNRVAKESKRITSSNLAIVFGQTLLRPKIETLEYLLRHSPKITSILKCLIENIEEIAIFSNLDMAFLERCFKDNAAQQESAIGVKELPPSVPSSNLPNVENVKSSNNNNESNANNNNHNNNNNIVNSPPLQAVEVSPEKQKLINIQVTVDSAIELLLQRLDSISAELNASTSIEETIEIAKIIRTAKRVLFTDDASTS